MWQWVSYWSASTRHDGHEGIEDFKLNVESCPGPELHGRTHPELPRYTGVSHGSAESYGSLAWFNRFSLSHTHTHKHSSAKDGIHD